MKKYQWLFIFIWIVFGCGVVGWAWISAFDEEMTSSILIQTQSGVVTQYRDHIVTIEDEHSRFYTCHTLHGAFDEGDTISITHTIDELSEDCQVIRYDIVKAARHIPETWDDNGIFSDYYDAAYRQLKQMNLDEKIGQLLLVRYPKEDPLTVLRTYHLGGYLFFEKDFIRKQENEIIEMIQAVQDASEIPLITAVDEEGGSVVRISSNPHLRSSRFQSSSELFQAGGWERIRQDTIEKSALLQRLGLNLNLAPVVDVCASENDYMYSRTLKQNSAITAEYASVVIETSKDTEVSYALKHFPGYGSNADTHIGASKDNRTLAYLTEHDIPPFQAGIQAGAEVVLVSHNIVTCMDEQNPASLSSEVHHMLRKDLGFTGIIMSDDIAMDALGNLSDVSVKAISAGNDMIITTDYDESFHSIKEAVQSGTLEEAQIDHSVFRILAWKYAKQRTHTSGTDK